MKKGGQSNSVTYEETDTTLPGHADLKSQHNPGRFQIYLRGHFKYLNTLTSILAIVCAHPPLQSQRERRPMPNSF